MDTKRNDFVAETCFGVKGKLSMNLCNGKYLKSNNYIFFNSISSEFDKAKCSCQQHYYYCQY